MKKLFVILGAASALALAGCNQGGTSDQYGTSSGSSSNSLQNSTSNNANGGLNNNNSTGNRSTSPGGNP